MGVQFVDSTPGRCLPPGPNSPNAPDSARHSAPSPLRSAATAVAADATPTAAAGRAVSFSIENILRPDFGRQAPVRPCPVFATCRQPSLFASSALSRLSTFVPQQTTAVAAVSSSPPLSPATPGLPVDLSSNRNTTASSSTTTSPAHNSLFDHKKSPDHQQRSAGQKNVSPGHQTSPATVNDPEKLADPPLPTEDKMVWPAWVYCTRYSDRPSSGPRSRRSSKPKRPDEKRPRTAFSNDQLQRLVREFAENRYLSEERRRRLSSQLALNESQIKIWFQNKRAKLKKSRGEKPLAQKLMEQGLYNHTTITAEEEERLMKLCQAQTSLS